MKLYLIIDGFAYTRTKFYTLVEAQTFANRVREDQSLICLDEDYYFDPNEIYIEEYEITDDDSETNYIYTFAMNGWADHLCAKCGHTENTDVHVRVDWEYCPYCGRKIVNGAKLIQAIGKRRKRR